MTIAREEIFGPVLAILPYDDEEEVIAHGQRHASTALPATCRSADIDAGPRASRRSLRAGNVAHQRRRRSISARRSAATSSPATAANAATFGIEEFLEIKAVIGYAAA